MPKARNIIAIGGGGFGANPGQGIIEEYILKQTKKKKPKICFIPTATGDNEAYIDMVFMLDNSFIIQF